MSVLLAPPNDEQSQLLNIVWPLFAEHHEFPIYQYVEHRMRKLGLDAAEVLISFPTLKREDYRAHYAAVSFDRNGALRPDTRVRLTMAGLFHVKDHFAMEIIDALLVYLRALSEVRDRIDEYPFAETDTEATFSEALKAAGRKDEIRPWVAEIALLEWLGMRVNRMADTTDVVGVLSFLTDANFRVIEDYLTAVTVAASPKPQVLAPEYHDPRALTKAITNFDITCELVLKKQMVKKPAIDRTALFAQDAATEADLKEGLSALGELLGGLAVPGNKPTHATGRLPGHIVQALPTIDQSQVQRAIDLFDAVRELRNSAQHPKPSAKLIQAHEHLGLPFPLRDARQSWDIIRAQMERAFTILQEEIYAARL